MIPIVEGTFSGPTLRGTVVGGGADWAVRAQRRRDGGRGDRIRADARWCADPIRNRGLRHGPAEVIQRLVEGDDVVPAEYYFRASPTFLCSGRRLRLVESRRLRDPPGASCARDLLVVRPRHVAGRRPETALSTLRPVPRPSPTRAAVSRVHHARCGNPVAAPRRASPRRKARRSSLRSRTSRASPGSKRRGRPGGAVHAARRHLAHFDPRRPR